MIQSFENRGGPEAKKERIESLRSKLRQRKLDGIIVPRNDRHLNEYLSEHDERLLWLTGFSGSAGIAIIMMEEAAIFVDGRYTLQVQSEVDQSVITPLPLLTSKPTKWLKQKIERGSRIGLDPNLLSVKSYEAFLDIVEQEGGKLISIETNPIDQIWQDQPPPPDNPVYAHQKKYAGEDAASKISKIQSILKERGVDAAVLTAPESICWLLNIRGSDVPHTPIMLANAIIHTRAKPDLFLDQTRIKSNALTQLKSNVKIQRPENFTDNLKTLGAKFKKVLINPDRTNCAIYQILRAARAEIVRGTDPCSLPKAIKNQAEIEGSRSAHMRDGIAICQFLHWLKNTSLDENGIDEIKAAIELENCRKNTGQLKDISFETISAAGANGAIVHYRVSENTNRQLRSGELYLVDSGAQYKDGTTDITRTIAIGEPTKTMQRHYTMVLKAHIALASATFPKGTRGMDLDPLARSHLWQEGLDFNHGTGHGVGSFLSVHEGPQNISKRGIVPLESGMIISNEPGYYKEGAYGIRLENLILVTELREIKGGEQPVMDFETLTLAPFERSLINQELMSKIELTWLNSYHKRVYKKLSASLSKQEKQWLKQQTAPLGEPN